MITTSKINAKLSVRDNDCSKKGHIQLDCQKKKKDEAEKKKKEGEGDSGSGSKVANVHELIPTTASIEEVNESKLNISLYSAKQMCWMMDSGVMHHMSPYKNDFADYAPCPGAVR